MQRPTSEIYQAGILDEATIASRAPSILEKESEKDLQVNTQSAETVVTPPSDDVVRVKSSELQIHSPLRKYLLLFIFCMAQFLDVFNGSSVFPAIPVIARDLKMNASEPVWIVSALSLTFSSFMLISGRISDVYSARWSFIIGANAIGGISIGTGFMRNKIGLFVLRAFNGIASALTIPASLKLITKVFPDPKEQAFAISMFAASAGIANTAGILVGALFVQFRSWHWVLWFSGIIGFSIGISGLLLIPAEHKLHTKTNSASGEGELKKLEGLDIIGVSILTISLILFIFAIVSGSSASGHDATSWGKPKVIVPLIISIFWFVGFFVYERTIPEDRAAIPPSIWFRPNFTVLTILALLPFLWFVGFLLLFVTYWQDAIQWTVIGTAARTLPVGIATTLVALTSGLAQRISTKYLILTGSVLEIIAGLIFPFAGRRDQYWSRMLPASFIGAAGTMLVYVNANIAIFQTTPVHLAGTVGAIFNSAIQLGTALGSSVLLSISTSIENKTPDGPFQYTGRADAVWFLFAVVVAEALCVLIFYKPTKNPASGKPKSDIEKDRPPVLVQDEKA